MESLQDKTLEEIFSILGTGRSGLTSGEAQDRLKKYGPNAVRERRGPDIFSIIIDQFRNYIVMIPIAASVIALAIGEYHDAAVIFLIVILNAGIGITQDYHAQRSISLLRSMSNVEVTVLRDGYAREMDVRCIVPGDVIILESGDIVPADSRLIHSEDLSVDESMLTGESVPVHKSPAEVPSGTPLTGRLNMVFMGTHVLDGKCSAIVIATGSGTELGRVYGLIAEAQKPVTPLEKTLNRFAKTFGIIVIAVSALIFITGLMRGEHIYTMFMAAMSVAVASVPEGLAATITVALSMGSLRMAKRNVIVRSLPIVETLGSTTVICTDKTGTLTENSPRVSHVSTILKDYDAGNMPDSAVTDRDFMMLVEIAAVCNDAMLQTAGGEGKYHGDELDVALAWFIHELGFSKDYFDSRYPRLAVTPFKPAIKKMVVISSCNGTRRVFVKGAPDVVIGASRRVLKNGHVVAIGDVDRSRMAGVNETLASNAMRVIAFAYRDIDSDTDISDTEAFAHDLVLVGLVGLYDPPRKGVHEAILVCKDAGIDIIMMTGDQKLTAVAIAKELDLFHPGDKVITGDMLDHMDIRELKRDVRKLAVCARLLPEQKTRIVNALQSNGEVVAMTGDGVNDAPALRLSDVGIAMGRSGTEVAREASDIVLVDDNFSRIVNAVQEGRVIFDNIKKFVKYLFTSNFGEVATIFLGLLIGLPLPLLAMQILWLNVITDGLPALALSADTPDPDIMRRPPRKSTTGLITRLTLLDMVIIGGLMSICTLTVFYAELPRGLEHARTMAFVMLVALHMWNAFNCRSEERSAFSMDIFSNPYLMLSLGISIALLISMVYLPLFQDLFYTVPISLSDWAMVLAISPATLIALEVRKFITRGMRAGRGSG